MPVTKLRYTKHNGFMPLP